MSSRLNSSPLFLNQFSFAVIVRPGTEGPPSTIRRTASPATSASIVLILFINKQAGAPRRPACSRSFSLFPIPSSFFPFPYYFLFGPHLCGRRLLQPCVVVGLRLDRVEPPHPVVAKAAQLRAIDLPVARHRRCEPYGDAF